MVGDVVNNLLVPISFCRSSIKTILTQTISREAGDREKTLETVVVDRAHG